MQDAERVREPEPVIKICIITSSGVDDGSFNQNIYEGVQAFIAANPDATVTPVKEETGETAAAVKAVADIVADYDVIVCCGFQFAGIGTLAAENPEVKFILVDTFPTDEEGNEVECDNLYAMQFKEQEGGFCAGMAAASSRLPSSIRRFLSALRFSKQRALMSCALESAQTACLTWSSFVRPSTGIPFSSA